jgi:glycosyltransferase involved in cell wall biosynthesis
MLELTGRVRVVKNVIPALFLDAPRREFEDPLVLFASRFVRMKGPFQLLEAVPSIRRCFPTAKFVFLGDGPDAPEFDGEIRRRGLTHSVQRIAHVTRHELARWYGRAWVLVFPTFFAEGMPMVMAEAMANGTPIVTTRTRFCRSYMAEGENCLYCEAQRPDSIAGQVIRLLSNFPMREAMSLNNRSFARGFSEDVVAGEFADIYGKLCSAGR